MSSFKKPLHIKHVILVPIKILLEYFLSNIFYSPKIRMNIKLKYQMEYLKKKKVYTIFIIYFNLNIEYLNKSRNRSIIIGNGILADFIVSFHFKYGLNFQ